MTHHLVTEHNLVIADYDKILDKGVYFEFWRSKFAERKEEPLPYYCSTIKTGNKSLNFLYQWIYRE